MKNKLAALLCSLIAAMALVACGGGGGATSGSSPSAAPTAPTAPANTSLLSLNTSPVTTTLLTFPVIAGTDNSSTYMAAGHFGATTAECYVTQTQPRNSTIIPIPNWSSLSLTDSPVYVMCAQADGSVQEVSQQLFGRQLAIQGEYPLVSDLNKDGIDDLVLFRACDCADATTEVHIFLSRPNGTYAEQLINNLTPAVFGTLPVPSTAGKQFSAMDINHDGNKDIVGPAGVVLLSDSAGRFSQSQYNDPAGVLNGWQYSTASCAADFAGLGHDQLLITDRGIPDGKFQHSAIFDFDNGLNVITRYELSTPYFSTVYNIATGAHEFACRTADVMNNGKPWVFVFTSNYYTTDATPKTYVQVYRNDSANGVIAFTDVSATALPGQVQRGGASYSPRIVDLNGDGFLDLVLDGQTYNGTSGAQVWINNKDGTFHQVFTDELSTLYSNYAGASAVPKEFDGMLPIKVNGKWNYVVQQRTNQNGQRFGIANTQYQFK